MEAQPDPAKSEFDEYFALRGEGAHREAYAVLRTIMETRSRWANCGDLFVWCADLELLLNDDLRRARELLERAHELGCQNLPSYYEIHGYVLWRMGQRTEGIQDLERSVALDPSLVNLRALGKVLSTEGDPRAISIWQRVLEQDPANCQAHAYLGREAFKVGDRGRALLMAKRAERLAKTDREFHEIGRLYMELEEFEAAINADLQAERLGYQPKGALYAAISACYFSLGEDGKARKYLEWAMRHNPRHEYVKYVYERSQTLTDEEIGGDGGQGQPSQ